MDAVSALLQTAKKENGYLEKASNSQLDDKYANAGYNNYTKYARDLDALGVYNGKKNGYAWCDVFCDWCFITTFGITKAMKMTYQPMRGYGAGCTNSAAYYRQNGRLYKSNPKPGDQIFFSKDGGKTYYHTGIVTKVSGGKVYTIEGNTSSAAGVVPNGGAVREKSYSLSYTQIGAYGRPNYSIITSSNLEGDDTMTQAEFQKMWIEMRKSLQDNDSSGYSKTARDWAINSKLIAGNGTTVNGEPNYMWEDLLTREQFVTVLKRYDDLLLSEIDCKLDEFYNKIVALMQQGNNNG